MKDEEIRVHQAAHAATKERFAADFERAITRARDAESLAQLAQTNERQANEKAQAVEAKLYETQQRLAAALAVRMAASKPLADSSPQLPQSPRLPGAAGHVSAAASPDLRGTGEQGALVLHETQQPPAGARALVSAGRVPRICMQGIFTRILTGGGGGGGGTASPVNAHAFISADRVPCIQLQNIHMH